MIFDAHGDILTHFAQQRKQGEVDIFKKYHLDLYKKGGVTHSIFVNYTHFEDPNVEDIFLEIIEESKIELNNNKDILKVCRNYDDLLKANQENKIGVILGIEGLNPLKDIEQLKSMYEDGYRHASLTWNEGNKYASGVRAEKCTGLTKKGKEVIEYMRDNNMIIDLAHADKKTYYDIMKLIDGPVIFSHGNAYSLCPVPRNLDDDQLKILASKNGVIGIAAMGFFISQEKENQDVSHLVDHIDYIKDLIGINHVGFGFDFCHYLDDPNSENDVEDLRQISDVVNIIKEMKKRGYTNEEIEKVKYKNFFRVIKDVLG